MIKKIIFMFVLSVFPLGCSTLPPSENVDDSAQHTEGSVDKEGLGLYQTNEVNVTTQDFIDLSSHAILWVVTYLNDYGQVERWIVSSIGFINNGGIWFSDSDGNLIMLYRNYSFMIIQLDDWVHDKYRIRKKVVPSHRNEHDRA